MILTFGELMLRLNPTGYKKIIQSSELEMSFAGSEANVAVSLANFNKKVKFVTKLPNNNLGERAMTELKKYGVTTDEIVRDNERMGLFFVEKGASQRPSKVLYDRKESSIALAKRSDFNWNEIFKDVKWFHFSGITPSLSKELGEICLEACKVAKEKGIKISCDLNYRKNLWTLQEAQQTMARYFPYFDVCIGNESDYQDMFGIDNNIEDNNLIGKKIKEKYPNIEVIAFSNRVNESADVNFWSGSLYVQNKIFDSIEYKINVVDRFGGGDSFSAALIYGLSNNFNNQKAVDFATAASCLKHSLEYDFNLTSVEEVYELMTGNADGKVQR